MSNGVQEQPWWVAFMDARKQKFKDALGVQRPFKQWFETSVQWIAKTTSDQTFKWGDVSQVDITSAFMAAASMGLLVDGSESMVMVRGKKKPVIRCEVGAAGVVRQAGNAGIRVNARTIREGDRIELDEGAGIVHHTPAWLAGGKSGGESLGYYAVAVYPDGRQVVRSMSWDEAQTHATAYGAWSTHPDPMGEKTMILNLRKVLFFGDAIEGIISASGAVYGDDDVAGIAEQEAAREPAYPPQSTRDKVLAQAAREEQDNAAEGFQAGDEEEAEPRQRRRPPSGPRGASADDAGPI